MSFLTRPTAPPDQGMADRMLAPEPERNAPARAGWWGLGLFLLCLVPRLGVAARQDVICRDGVYYIELASALESGDWSRSFGSIGLNVYPAALATLHTYGLDFPTAGKLWGVLLASLAVLPLFGWVRRLFDDRVALTTALLYAAHPKLIEWSPELVRDPTFWFLWSASIYCLVRALLEVRVGWFLAAGVSTALAVHTRFEGWLLYLPWLAWGWHRLHHLLVERIAFARGLVAGLVAYPVLLVVVNVTCLHDCPTWQLGSFQRLQYVRWWWQGAAPETALRTLEQPVHSDVAIPNSEVTRVAFVQPLVGAAAPRVTSARFVLQYLDALRRGFDLGYGLLAAWGIWR